MFFVHSLYNRDASVSPLARLGIACKGLPLQAIPVSLHTLSRSQLGASHTKGCAFQEFLPTLHNVIFQHAVWLFNGCAQRMS
jgi:hypothetical protein